MLRVVGTNSYMAPEVREHKKYQSAFDPEKVDIFTVGVTFFILYFGSVPFNISDKRDLYYQYIYK